MSDAPRLYRALHRSAPPMVARYFPIAVEGSDNVPADEAVILASNHLSFLDSVVLGLQVDRPVYFLGKADYFESWRTRWFFRATGVVPVHRDGGVRGEGSIRAGVEILRRGDLLGIYPEGTRSPDGRLYRGKTGPVRIALEAGARIVPCALSGTGEAMPTGARVPRRRPVTLRFGEPLDFARYRDRRDDVFALRSATDELMYEIMRLSGQEYVDEYAANVKSGEVDLNLDLRTDLQHAESPSAEEPPSGDERRAS